MSSKAFRKREPSLRKAHLLLFLLRKFLEFQKYNWKRNAVLQRLDVLLEVRWNLASRILIYLWSVALSPWVEGRRVVAGAQPLGRAR